MGTWCLSDKPMITVLWTMHKTVKGFIVTALLSLKSFTNTGVAGTEVQQKAKIFFSCFIVRFLPAGLLLSVSNLVTCVLSTFSPTYWCVKSTLNATSSKNKRLWCLQHGGWPWVPWLVSPEAPSWSWVQLWIPGLPGGMGEWVSLAHFSSRPRGWKLGAAPDMSTGSRHKCLESQAPEFPWHAIIFSKFYCSEQVRIPA